MNTNYKFTKGEREASVLAGEFSAASSPVGDVQILSEFTLYGEKYIVTSIGRNAFYNCKTKMTSVVIPSSVKDIGVSAFEGCAFLKQVTISNATSIGSCAFKNCGALLSVEMQDTPLSIGSDAFYGTKWYTSYYDSSEDGLFYIDNILFGYKGTEPVGAIEIKEGTQTIAESAFSNCTGITSVSFPSSLRSIDYKAFLSCNNITELNFNEGLTDIGEFAFSGCSGISTVNIPLSMATIGRNAFKGCHDISSVKIEDLSSWLKISFEGENANPLYARTLNNKNALYLNNKRVEEVIIPSTITSIKEYAFAGCCYIKSVSMNHVTSIGKYAFYRCDELETISMSDANFIDECAFGGCFNLNSVTIPQGLDSIGVGVFEGAGMKSIKIPSNIGKICASAFAGSSLEEIHFEKGVTNIGAFAFKFCWDLTAINIPSSVTEIGNGAFWDCNKLSSVSIPGSITHIGEYNQEIEGETNVEIIPVSA